MVHVESELWVSGGGQRGGEFTKQDITAVLRNAKIVAMWAERAVKAKKRHQSRGNAGADKACYKNCRTSCTDPGAAEYGLAVAGDK